MIRCLGVLIGMVVAFIVGIGLILGFVLILKQCSTPPPTDQQLYSAPDRWGG